MYKLIWLVAMSMESWKLENHPKVLDCHLLQLKYITICKLFVAQIVEVVLEVGVEGYIRFKGFLRSLLGCYSMYMTHGVGQIVILGHQDQLSEYISSPTGLGNLTNGVHLVFSAHTMASHTSKPHLNLLLMVNHTNSPVPKLFQVLNIMSHYLVKLSLMTQTKEDHLYHSLFRNLMQDPLMSMWKQLRMLQGFVVTS